jgi:ParB family transcriptional regulator, chromosome partitioning protein
VTTDVSPETSDPLTDRDAVIHQIPLEHIHPNPNNPRRTFRTSGPDWDLFVSSIKEIGVQQPILVRNTPDGEYEIVAGHRRYAGLQAAQRSTAPAIVRDLTDEQALVIMLVENLQRVDLDPVEEATGFFRLVECGMTQAEMAEKVGRSVKHVSERLQLLKAPAKVLAGLKKGVFTIEDALEYAKTDDKEIVDRALALVAEGQWPERALGSARHHVEEERLTKVMTEDLEAKGFRFVTFGRYGVNGTELKDAGLTPLSDLGMKNSPKGHEDKPWLVAILRTGHKEVTWATDDKRAARQYAPKEAAPESEKAKTEAKRAKAREDREAQAAEDARLAVAVQRKVSMTELVSEAGDIIVDLAYTDLMKKVCKLLDLEVAKVNGFYDWKQAVREQVSAKLLIHAIHGLEMQRAYSKEGVAAFEAFLGEPEA